MSRLTDLGSNPADRPNFVLKMNVPPGNVARLLESLGSALPPISPPVLA